MDNQNRESNISSGSADNLKARQDKLGQDITNLQLLMSGIVVVLLLGFLTLLFTLGALIIDSWNVKTQSYQTLEHQIQLQNYGKPQR